MANSRRSAPGCRGDSLADSPRMGIQASGRIVGTAATTELDPQSIPSVMILNTDAWFLMGQKHVLPELVH
jgi:hypothetical protein